MEPKRSLTSKNRESNIRIGRRLDTFEKALKSKLLKFYKEKLEPFQGLLPVETLKATYEKQIYAVIRKSIQDSYNYATDEIEKAAQEKYPDFVAFGSTTDADNIKKTADTWNGFFWTEAGKLLSRNSGSETKIKNNEEIELKELDVDAALLTFAIGVNFTAFNISMWSKMGQILPGLPPIVPLPPGIGVTTTPPPIQPNLGAVEIGFSLSYSGPGLMFLTAEDARVDPLICEPLNRRIYDPIKDSPPLPPLHKRCRCRLLPTF